MQVEENAGCPEYSVKTFYEGNPSKDKNLTF